MNYQTIDYHVKEANKVIIKYKIIIFNNYNITKDFVKF